MLERLRWLSRTSLINFFVLIWRPIALILIRTVTLAFKERNNGRVHKCGDTHGDSARLRAFGILNAFPSALNHRRNHASPQTFSIYHLSPFTLTHLYTMSPTISGLCSTLTYYWRLLASPFTFLPTRLRGLGAFLAVCSVLATFAFFNFLPYDAIDDRIACSLHDEIFRRPSPSLVGLYSREDGGLSLDEVMRMIESTAGLFARDYSLGLGWNNVRLSYFSGTTVAAVIHSLFDETRFGRCDTSSNQRRSRRKF